MLYLDIETFCALDVRKTNVYRYVEDPSFLILVACWAVDDGPVHVAIGRDAINRIPGLWDPAVPKVAHNAAFERICFSRFEWQMGFEEGTGPTWGWPDYIDPRTYVDTMTMAAELGYPQALGHLARALGGEQKDAGTLLINFFCKPNRKGQRNLPEDHPEKWAEFVAYCAQDVEALRSVHRKLLAYGKVSRAELNAYIASELINDRGVKLDLPMVGAAIEAAELNKADDLEEMRQLTGLDNPGSVAQLLPWLQGQGLKSMGDLQAETVARKLASPLLNSGSERADRVRRVLTLRQQVALTASKKFYSMADGVCADGRLRGQFRFFGAHTGRWSGRGVQLHNLARSSLGSHKVSGGACTCGQLGADAAHEASGNAAEVEAAVLDLLMGQRTDSATLKKLVRPTIVLEGTVVDYAAIEARVVADLAGEEWALDAFRKGRDIYVETAERMSTPGNRLTRSQGKVAVLALGYNGGIASLRAMGGEGTDEELQTLVSQWRAANPAIVQLWADLGNAFKHGGQAGRLRVDIHGRDRWLVLPSGRAIVYHDVIIDERFRFKDPYDPTGKKWKVKVADGFANPNPDGKGPRSMTYGGRLTENATQAVARDILAEALVRLERAGYRTVGHVHDEAMVEGVHDVERVRALMCQPPSWAGGLPVDGEGFTTYRYKKG